MKKLIVSKRKLSLEGRWDLDYHLPPEEIIKFPSSCLKKVGDIAQISTFKRNPELSPEDFFKYVDISCIDTNAGNISIYQDLLGSEAPSRARKVILEYDVIISTVRPTRKAVAVVPKSLHEQICSTGFSVLRATDINPFYLKFALRLPSTSEQFRKFATGSSYPAILDSDVLKTLIPVPSKDEQDDIVGKILQAELSRDKAIRAANAAMRTHEMLVINQVAGREIHPHVVDEVGDENENPPNGHKHTIEILKEIKLITAKYTRRLDIEGEQLPLFDEPPSN